MKKIILYVQVLLVSVLVVSCSEDYLDVNVDPNNPTQVSPDLLLPVAQTYTADLIYENNRTNTLGNLIMYNWSQADGYSWYTTEFQYLVNSTFYDIIWNMSYQNALNQYQTLQGLDPIYDNYKAISTIMQSFHFQKLVDVYGDIPYFEALQRSADATPAFDDAQVVYEDLIVKLDEAIALIDATQNNADAVNPGASDVMYNGDMAMWKTFANTLKLKILVRQSEMTGREAYLTEQFNVIQNSGLGFIVEDAAINPGYVNQENKQNPFWEDYGLTVGEELQNNFLATAATDYVIEYLQNTSDPRIDFIYEEPASGHRGVPQGLLEYPADGSLDPENVSNLGPGLLKSPSQDAVILLAAESYFLQAEAVLKGYLPGNAQALYEAGIQASFNYLGAGDAAFYYNQPIQNIGWTASTNKLEAIITQKWIGLNGINGLETWIEFNRTGYPVGLPISATASQNSRPVRLLYSAAEVSANPENVPAQADPFTDKIFWAN